MLTKEEIEKAVKKAFDSDSNPFVEKVMYKDDDGEIRSGWKIGDVITGDAGLEEFDKMFREELKKKLI